MTGPGPTHLLMPEATVVDGTGRSRFVADLAIIGGRVEVRPPGSVVMDGAQALATAGLVVAPGFIDLHSHSGLRLLADPAHEAKVLQGVTTEVIGVDGLSYAPFHSLSDLADLIEMNSGLDGPLLDRTADWRSVADYLDRFGALGLNVAMLVGNTPVRINALGWDDRAADRFALDRMRDDIHDAMVDGAFGISSGLDYPPGSFATTEELVASTKAAAALGGFYHTHVRYDLGDRFLDPFREAIHIGKEACAGVHLTHFYHGAWMPGSAETLLALIDEAAPDADITFDTYPSEWGSTRLLIELPSWIQVGGPRRLKERLADRSARTRLRKDLQDRGSPITDRAAGSRVRLGAFTNPRNLELEGLTIVAVVARRGGDAVDVVCDLLLDESLGINQVMPGPPLPGLRLFLSHPGAMIGTDSVFVGSKPSPRTWGSYPRVLGQFVREERLVSLEEAVRKMTSAPAARLGLDDRGSIRDGSVADLVIFDPDTVRSPATYDDPVARPEGIAHVLVGGEFVVRDGRVTGARPGRVLRRGSS